MLTFYFILIDIMVFSIPASACQIWVANGGGSTLSIIKGSEIKSIPCGKGPREIVYSSLSRKVYVNECENQSLSIFDLNTQGKIDAIKLPHEARGFTLSSDQKKLYFVLKDLNELCELNLQDKEVERCISMPAGPRNLATDTPAKNIYVSCNTANCIAVVDSESFTKILEFPTASQPYSVKIHGETIYVSSIGENLIQAYDIKTHKLMWEVHSGLHPTTIDFDHDGNLMVTNFDKSKISLFHSKTGKVLRQVKTGKEPFDIKKGLSGFVVSHHGENSVGLYDRSWNLISTHLVGQQPHGLCTISSENQE